MMGMFAYTHSFPTLRISAMMIRRDELLIQELMKHQENILIGPGHIARPH